VDENVYTQPDTFSWRRSTIRQDFLAALQPPSKKAPAADVVHTPSPRQSLAQRPRQPSPPPVGDQREAELAEAKRLIDIPHDDLRQKTIPELEALVVALRDQHAKVLAQTNYWLDAREQLVMDAEMQNKIIASLVNYVSSLGATVCLHF
jgi:hypothetical protein